jgi:lipopolysaccharide export system protein LptC
MNTRTWIGLGLLVAAVASGWSVLHQRARPVVATAEEDSYDYVAHDVRVTAFNADTGKISGVLQAPMLRRLRADQTLDLQTPLFLLPDNQGRDWHLAAQRGWVSAKGDEMRLTGEVSGDSPTTGDVPPTTLRTATLTVFPDKHLATTADPVTLTRPGIMQSGTGMQVNLQSRQYSLLSQVKTRYEPNKVH